MTIFNPTTEVVTFRLRGWCMLHVLFVAAIHPSRTVTPGSFESVRWNACVHKLDLGLCTPPKEFWGNGVRTHVNSKGQIPSIRKILPRGGLNPQRCIKQDSEPNTLPTSYSGPHNLNQLRRHGNLRTKTCGVMFSTSAFLAFHPCYCAGSSLAWGLNLRALVCGIF